MGSGKSHTGKKLAEKLGFEFIDLDQSIEAEAGCTISAIFKEQGEQQFRVLEQAQLLALKDRSNIVISTGGGAPCFFDNMNFMNENGLTIYLRTPANLLVNRLFNELDSRPLIAELATEDVKLFLEDQLKERSGFYERAKMVYFQEEEGQLVEDELVERMNLLKISMKS